MGGSAAHPNMNKFKLAVGVLMSLAFPALAGELQNTGSQLSNKSIPPDGALHNFSYVNTTGHPIYITQLKVFVIGGSYTGGVCTGWMMACKANEQDVSLTYWSRYVDDGHPQGAGSVTANQINESYAPNYVTVLPGESIMMQVLAAGFGGKPAFVSAWVWYTLKP